MRKFDINEAKAGKPVCTRKGDKARIICTDLKYLDYHIIAAVWDSIGEQEEVLTYTDKGEHCEGTSSDFDLMMADEEPKCPFKPFDKVLIRDGSGCSWCCALFSHIEEVDGAIYYYCHGFSYDECIPYNEETEHLVGTTDAPPEKYVIW